MNRKILDNLGYMEAGLFKALKEARGVKRAFRNYPDWHKSADDLADAIRTAWNEADDLCTALEVYLDEEDTK